MLPITYIQEIMEPFCSTVFNFVVSELQPLTFYVKEFGFLLSILFGIAIVGNVLNCFFFIFILYVFQLHTRSDFVICNIYAREKVL